MKKTYILLLCIIASCRSKAPAEEETQPEAVQTPVNVTHIQHAPMQNSVELNATASYLQYNFMKASANGYISAVHLQPGNFVRKGEEAFTLQTKESHAIGNTINKLDSSFHLNGTIHVRTAVDGYVQELNHQSGDYVQDGEQLAVLSDAKSFGFVLNVPFELIKFINNGGELPVKLPDGRQLAGRVSSILPLIDSVTQTQRVLLKINDNVSIPQNLIAKVELPKQQVANAASLPKQAVLTNETQTIFWVMKMTDSVTAVKVEVKKGLESGDKVQILEPEFSQSDLILTSGNYGLPDTAKVKIVNSEQ